MVEENNINLNILPYKIKELTENKQSFIEFCYKRAAIRKYGKSFDTQKRYDRFIRLFKEWGRIINFEDVTDKNIISYDEYLTKKGLKVYSKWNNYHRFLNTFILDAISENLLPTNPYKWVNIQKDKGYKGLSKCLSPSEFDKLQRVQVYTKSLERVKDLFIFQTYTCLSYSDLKDFCADRLHNINGMQVYISKRHKTGKTFTIPLMKPALDILYKYNNVLPIISNVKYNAYLKVIAQAAGIDKPISSHWARHTGATLLLNKGIPMQIIAKICGHSSTKITEQVYAKLLDETVVDAIKTLRLSQARGKT
jgi:site-specific recombinase XerD